MGRKAAVTYEQVAEAADAMKKAGGKPSSRLIRERLGHVGSMGSIHKMLQAWRTEEQPATGSLTLPAPLQRALLDFMQQELASAKTVLEAALAEQQQEAADLAVDNERQAADIEDRNETVTGLQAERATLSGRLGHMETDLAAVKDEASRARDAAETARVELAKALLRVEAMTRLEAELLTLRGELETERQGRVAAEQQAAVLAAKLEAAITRTTRAETEATDALAQVRETRDALSQEAAKVSTAQTTIATLNGKLDALQAQASELAAARQEAKKASEGVVERRGKRGQAGGKPAGRPAKRHKHPKPPPPDVRIVLLDHGDI